MDTIREYDGNGEVPKDVTVIVVKDGVKSIPQNTFRGCTELVSIRIPDTVIHIGYGAFAGCKSLTSINLPPSIDIVDKYAFRGCESLTSVQLPPSTDVIKNGAFYGCSSLTSINLLHLPLRKIENYAFRNCTSLTSIQIPETLERISMWAFEGCTSLTTVTLPQPTISFCSEPAVFSNCTSLTSIHVPASTGYYTYTSNVFQKCPSITSVHFYQSSDGISDNAIKFLIEMMKIYPQIARNPCTDDFLYPLHIITIYGFRFENEMDEPTNPIMGIMNAVPDALSTTDPKYDFYPFLLAACDLKKSTKDGPKFCDGFERLNIFGEIDHEVLDVEIVYILLREAPWVIASII